MKPKSYIAPLSIENKQFYELDTDIWSEGMKRLYGKVKHPSRIVYTYLAYKTKAPKESLPSRVTVWRHKKVWEAAGFL